MDAPPITGPFQARKASESLREQLEAYLRKGQAGVGQPFFSDSHLMRLSGLSRKTVRRALDQLQREGWIERRPGRGSYVGPRAALPVVHRREVPGKRTVVRLAVLVYGMSGDMPDWYSQGVLAGLDEAAVDQAVSIELLGDHSSDVSILAQRLAQSQPDVLAVMPSTSKHVYAIAEARRIGIPCIVTGTRLHDLGLPAICEDGVQGAAAAVAHLAERGHRRIGFVHRPDTAQWVFARREGYIQGLKNAGIEHDERLVCWMSSRFDPERWADELQEYLNRYQPTALLLSSGMLAVPIGVLQRRIGLKVPDDLSVVSFDQYYAYQQMHTGLKFSTVELPLREMGRQLARMARDIAEKKELPPVTTLPCTVAEHQSVAVRHT